jgi:hypothetical protein
MRDDDDHSERLRLREIEGELAEIAAALRTSSTVRDYASALLCEVRRPLAPLQVLN